jgi:hypothetical protein
MILVLSCCRVLCVLYTVCARPTAAVEAWTRSSVLPQDYTASGPHCPIHPLLTVLCVVHAFPGMRVMLSPVLHHPPPCTARWLMLPPLRQRRRLIGGSRSVDHARGRVAGVGVSMSLWLWDPRVVRVLVLIRHHRPPTPCTRQTRTPIPCVADWPTRPTRVLPQPPCTLCCEDDCARSGAMPDSSSSQQWCHQPQPGACIQRTCQALRTVGG